MNQSSALLMQTHPDFAYVYACYDPKITDALFTWCEERFGKGNFIFDCDAGAVKNLVSPHKQDFSNFVLWKMSLAHEKVHPCGRIILINHSSCGAYADAGITFTEPQAEEVFHQGELEKAKALLEQKFPGIPVEIHYFLKAEQRMVW